MNPSEELLQKIVKETLNELGHDANLDLVHKVVKEVLRRLEQQQNHNHQALPSTKD